MMRLAAIVLFLAATAPVAAAPPKDLVMADLLADVKTVRPGQPFTLGVHLRIKDGWHVYWQYPGDAGMATRATFTAPDGFTVTPQPFPLPKSFLQPGAILGYGYEESLVLLATVTPPKDLKPGASVKFSADVAWLCCQEICVPGQAKPELQLSVSADEPRPDNADLFAAWKDRLPQDPAAAKNVKITRLQGNTPAASPVPFELIATIDPAPRVPELFPDVPRSLELSDLSVKLDGTKVTATFQARVLAGQKLATRSLPAVLAWTDAQGIRRGIRVEFPLDPNP